MVGGLLVAAAAVGVTAASTAGGDHPGNEVVVATAAVDPGSVIPAGAVRVERADLPASTADRTFSDPDEVVGGVALAPLEPGEVVQRSAVRTGGGTAPHARTLAFALERSRALNGELRRGERVDVLATHGTGDTALTTVVAAGATVVAVDAGDAGTVGSTGTVVLTLAPERPEEVLALAHAVDTAGVTVVRSPGSADTALPDRYRAPAP